MSDIFISYASEDREQAKVLAEALESQGWSVWWDRTIPFGRPYHQVIEEALAGARSVMVVWSAISVASNWVRAEAGEGMDRGVLVPVSIDDARPPLVFRQFQTADLRGWKGDPSAPVFRKLMADLTLLLGRPPAPTVAPLTEKKLASRGRKEEEPRTESPETGGKPGRQARRDKPGGSRRWGLRLAVVLIVGVLGGWLLWPWIEPWIRPSPAPAPDIVFFEADPRVIPRGESTTLRWRTRNGSQVEISSLGPVESSGERRVQPTETRQYTLMVYPQRPDGRAERSIQVEVVPPREAPPPPEILDFRASRGHVRPGESVRLSWETRNAEMAGLARRTVPSGNQEAHLVPTSGSEEIENLTQTTLFTLIAANPEDERVTREVEVRVEVAPREGHEARDRFAGPLRIREGWAVDFDSRRVVDPGEAGADLVIAPPKTTRWPFLSPLPALPGAELVQVQGEPGLEECRRARLRPEPISLERLPAGSHLCVRTDEGRLVLVTIVEDFDRVQALVVEW